MFAARTSWRILVAILQIAALIAFQMPASAHFGSKHASSGPAMHVHAQATEAVSEPSHHHAGVTAVAANDTADHGKSHGACCLGCCSCSCHAFASAPDASNAPVGRIVARSVPLASDRAAASVTLEAPPEPPRPFA